MKYEDTKFEVREYWDFPSRDLRKDKIIREFDTLEEAQFESMYLNRKARLGERYYVIDNPHEEVKLTARQRKNLLDKYGLR